MDETWQNVHGDHHIGAHLPHHIDRNVVEHAPIHQPQLAHLHRLKDAWNGDRSAHRVGHTSAVEDHLATGVEVNRYQREWPAQIRELRLQADDTCNVIVDARTAHQSRLRKGDVNRPEHVTDPAGGLDRLVLHLLG